MTTPQIVTRGGRRYVVHEGRLLLNWRDRPVRFHAEGCMLCCTYRVQHRAGGAPRHPGDACPRCGTGWRGTRPDPCAHCGYTAHLTDDDGRPVHKTCAETAALAAEGDRYGREAA
ncbi:hypothetical protein AB0H37_43375 [Actinomadura sp. NPDC023710]|uniref:hypothetical protein n=1 Tax=Actinomadura sp. NPDC023710 TaxID=3158219 RepID=UPI0033CBC8EA